jgi:hypothetical protein
MAKESMMDATASLMGKAEFVCVLHGVGLLQADVFNAAGEGRIAMTPRVERPYAPDVAL